MAISEKLREVNFISASELKIFEVEIETSGFNSQTAFFQFNEPEEWAQAEEILPRDPVPSHVPTQVGVIADHDRTPKLIIIAGIDKLSGDDYLSIFPADPDSADVLIKRQGHAISLGLIGHVSADDCLAKASDGYGKISVIKKGQFFLVQTHSGALAAQGNHA